MHQKTFFGDSVELLIGNQKRKQKKTKKCKITRADVYDVNVYPLRAFVLIEDLYARWTDGVHLAGSILFVCYLAFVYYDSSDLLMQT